MSCGNAHPKKNYCGIVEYLHYFALVWSAYPNKLRLLASGFEFGAKKLTSLDMIRLTTLARLRGLGNRAARPQLRRISDGNAGNTSYATGEEKRRKKVAVAMSGGVDSAACAYLLQKEGYDCVGVFMRNWDSSDEEGGNSACTLSQDLKDMQQVCARLGIPTVEVDFMKEYWHDVFVSEHMIIERYESMEIEWLLLVLPP